MNWLDVEEPQSWCPECHAPWAKEHEIRPVEWPGRFTEFVLYRDGCPASGQLTLGEPRSRAERELLRLADPESARDLWRTYEQNHRERVLLDRLEDRGRRTR